MNLEIAFSSYPAKFLFSSSTNSRRILIEERSKDFISNFISETEYVGCIKKQFSTGGDYWGKELILFSFVKLSTNFITLKNTFTLFFKKIKIFSLYFCFCYIRQLLFNKVYCKIVFKQNFF